MSFDTLGIVAPHPPIMVDAVGGVEARVTQASADALRNLRTLLDRCAPETLIVISPHAPAFSDAFAVTGSEHVSGDLGAFRAASVVHDGPGDPELAAAIIEAATTAGLPAVLRERYLTQHAKELDHGVLVPLSFLDPDSRYPLVVASLSGLPAAAHLEFGRSIREAARAAGRRVALVASGDMSHRLTPNANAGYSPRARGFDEQMVALLGRSDFHGIANVDSGLREEAGECGWRSLLILGGYLEGSDAIGRVLSYEGPWGVGYLTAAFAPESELRDVPALTLPSGVKGGTRGDAESEIVRLARATIDSFVREGITPAAPTLADPDLPARAGAFVSLHRGGDLRGCIGTIGPTQASLAEEVVHNAIEAATHDPRFPPVTASELDDLDIKVDVLHEPEAVDSLADLDPRTYGVITTCGWRRGLLLPDLEGVDTCEQQVAIAMSKAGIRVGEEIELARFKVDRYE